MTCRSQLFALIVTSVLVSGCAAPARIVEPQAPIQSLAEVNDALAGAPFVTIWLADGETVEDVSDVEVSTADVRFVRRGEPVAVPVGRVEQITVQPRRDAGRGVAIGATPGLVIAGVGLAGSAAAVASDNGSFVVLLGFLAMVPAGGVLALAGGIVGGVGGSRIARGDAVRVYQAPVERYLEAPAAAPPD